MPIPMVLPSRANGEEQPAHRIRRWTIAGAAILMAAWTAAWAVAAHFDRRATLLVYSDGAGANRAAELEEAGRRADLAVALNPLDANYRLTRAQIASARAALEHDDTALRLRAAEAHAQAVARRPAWGIGWAGLATARQAAGQPPGEILAALRRAIYFAPREPIVRQTALRLGTALLEDLASGDRDTILWVATYTLERDAKLLRELAGDAAVAERLRALFAGTEQAAALDAALGRGR